MMHAPIWWYAWLGVVLLCGALSGEDGHAGGDQQVVAAAPDEADHMGRYAMALATHEPISSMAATGTPSSSSGSCVRG